MIVILASRNDATARALSECWRVHDARLLTARDLALPGWQHRLGDPDGKAVIAGDIVVASEIQAVLTLLPGVWAGELAEIVPDDREYVGGEMTAFLLSWLSSLRCPVLNRPTATGLAGPFWRRERWLQAATRAGIRVPPLRRHAEPGVEPVDTPWELAATNITVIGERTLGQAADLLHIQARQLAQLAGVDLLVAEFDASTADARFVRAHYAPNVQDEHIAAALLEYLIG